MSIIQRFERHLFLVGALALAIMASGCLSTTPSMIATGEPLEARSHSYHVNAYASINTNSIEYVDEHDNFVFDGHFQGAEQIDELDFYALTGDTAAVEGLQLWREAKNRQTLATVIVTLASIAVAATGGIMYAASGNEEPDALSSGLVLGGAIGMTVGYLVIPGIFGPDEDLNEHGYLYDHDRAEAAANSYNSTLGE